MKRTVLCGFLASGGVALALSAACGTVLGITPDDQSATDGGGASEAGNDGSARPDGEMPTPDGFDALLTPSTVSLVAGDATGASLVIDVFRPTDEARSVVSVTFNAPADIIAKSRSDNDFSAGRLRYDITALPTATPGRESVVVTVSNDTHTVNRALTILLGRRYTSAGATQLDLTGPATFVIKAWGAGGQSPLSGAGGYAEGTITLGVGSYAIIVGGAPPGGGTGGNPGGGSASGTAKAGGGYSGVFAGTTPQPARAQVVAGAGGGACFSSGANAGGGGGTTGSMHAGDGVGSPGSGATVGAGGTGGPGPGTEQGQDGSALQGGNAGVDPMNAAVSGGGGGGGYRGGGGGGANASGASSCSAGGGGSSFVIGTASAPSTIGANETTPGNAADPDRGTAGDVGKDGAVVLIPQ